MTARIKNIVYKIGFFKRPFFEKPFFTKYSLFFVCHSGQISERRLNELPTA